MRHPKNNARSENRRWKRTPETQDRSLHTRQQLLEAARTIISRDGFDLTKLDDIAELACKSRGAVYAHFQNKEDIFFSIFEEDLSRRPHPPAGKDIALIVSGRICIELEQFVRSLEDKRQWLLYLELNLYARRVLHPSPRFLRLFEKIRAHSPCAEVAAMFAAVDACEKQ